LFLATNLNLIYYVKNYKAKSIFKQKKGGSPMFIDWTAPCR